MKTLTIRGLPNEVHEHLKERAKRNRRSLNQEVIAELAEAVAGGNDAMKNLLKESDASYVWFARERGCLLYTRDRQILRECRAVAREVEGGV